MPKRWHLAEPVGQEIRAQFPDIHPVILQLLWNRGMRTQEVMDVFFGPDWARDTHPPSQFSNMAAAVTRVFQALERGEVITVHGDYDADGVCGSAVLVSTLRDICRQMKFDEKKITFYLPHREKEGYGLAVSTIEYLHEHEHTRLVITVDCGISNKPAIDRGRELGIDTIVCDHHTMPPALPEKAILIHPLVPGETYPNKTLCGTGVAFKLASGLIEEARRRGANFVEGHEKWLLDLVAIATVTDVMPLAGENRVLETFGLLVLNKTRRVGLKKLLEVAGVKPGAADTFTVGFQIGPRINAAGRMHHANAALHLLLEEDETKATELARELHRTNISRQQASELLYQAAKATIGDPAERKILFAVGDGWGAGLVGLIASKLVGEFHRPILVIGRDGERYVGSGRSIHGFNITSALHAAEGFLDKFGGHPQACGFSTHGADRLASALARIEEYATRELSDEILTPLLSIDAELPLEEVDWNLWNDVARFAPFGEGNPKPIFAARDLTVAGLGLVGDGGRHLRLTLRSPRGKLGKMIGFRMGEWQPKLKLGGRVDAAFELGVNEWNENRELQMKLIDLKTCS
jgi:single-stranded-DNA-specific exonuclease